MMLTILLLTVNDLAVAFKNKTVYLMTFIPLFVFCSLAVLDRPSEQRPKVRLALVSAQSYDEAMTSSLKASSGSILTSWVATDTEAQTRLLHQSIDGYLLPDGRNGASSTLVVAKRESLQTLALILSLSELQRSVEEPGRVRWISEVRALQASTAVSTQTMPIWILMLVLLVGFLVVPPQVAEDKEKRLILALLQTPVREVEWLIAKVAAGMILTTAPIALLHLVSRSGFGHVPSYVALLAAASFCFCAIGVFLGLLCRTQASARALGVVFYLPHLLPSALSEFSTALTAVAVFIPSYQFFVPMKAILLENRIMDGLMLRLLSLLALGLVGSAASVALLKRRWLM